MTDATRRKPNNDLTPVQRALLEQANKINPSLLVLSPEKRREVTQRWARHSAKQARQALIDKG